jgi:hypothetical protein
MGLSNWPDCTLEDAGCTDADLLGHLRGPGPHVRGCWAVDLVLGKSWGNAMWRRKLVLALAGLAVVVAAGVVVLWPRPPSRITRENYARVRVGMNRTEVYAILGPAGDDRTGPVEYSGVAIHGNELGPAPFEGRNFAFWLSDQAYIVVIFDEDERVQKVPYCLSAGRRISQGPLDNLLWRAKRQWHRWFS